MPLHWIILCVGALALIGYATGRARALASADGNVRLLHSLPGYYGANVAMTTIVPAMGVLVIWALIQPLVVNALVLSDLPASAVAPGSSADLVMSDVRRVADGLTEAIAQGVTTQSAVAVLDVTVTDLRALLGSVGVAVGSNVSNDVLQLARSYRALNATGNWMMTLVVLAIALAGFVWAARQADRDYRARNTVEKGMKAVLVAAASIAILTTLGIVLSLVFSTIEFFGLYPAKEFFFSLTWAPSFGGGSELGLLPLLWGTLYISLIALLVAVPIGLFAAIYLAEYASPKLRAFAKPTLELLAGIPTIVYGLFALLTVGPLLMRVFGDDGLGWMQAGTAVMTAGLVMGIMLIPFVSSLSDDIINSVPQSLRDGSYGLGATRSETIKQVILPAALPGIAGAILLAASRAIGETMIVVLGAGAAARLSMNPFDAMTTVTAKIVSQLTGDADFASPEALVAFALGMSLFVITLGLNVLALYIVRKYREQYE
ncbi:phosphate ABC transporter permease subunit PstC [Marivita sp. S0852]|uniref:phosphate ABC transporter permease subunit PstC n=1 Tax=Marivita sp. S0852 TaxID=3373893 RepID=UPI003981CDE3